MKKLNILIICDSVTHQTGGAFISPLRFAELLKKRGHKIIFLAAKYPSTPKIDDYKGIKVYRFRSFALPKFEKLIRFAFPTKKEIEEIIKIEKINIVHIMIPGPASIFSINAAKKNNIILVSHSHTQPENLLLHMPLIKKSRVMNHLIYKYLTWLYNKNKITVCPSKFAERMLKKHKPELNTVVISNGVDISKFNKKNPDEFKKKFNISKKDKIILYVGRLHPEKCVDSLIKSMEFISKEDKDIKLIIVGGGYLKENLENLSHSLNLEKCIKFLGKISNQDLVLAYNACDIFVLPSLAELEGMVVLEAMACGKPLIIANSKDSASIDLINENGLIFEPNNAKDLAENIIKIFKNDKLRRVMGEKSYKLSKEYDINKSISKLEEVYYSLLK